MRVLEVNVGFQEQGTNIQVAGRGKQGMQVGNMSLKRSLEHSARGQRGHGATRVAVSHRGVGREMTNGGVEGRNGKKKTRKTLSPSFSLRGDTWNNNENNDAIITSVTVL